SGGKDVVVRQGVHVIPAVDAARDAGARADVPVPKDAQVGLVGGIEAGRAGGEVLDRDVVVPAADVGDAAGRRVLVATDVDHDGVVAEVGPTGGHGRVGEGDGVVPASLRGEIADRRGAARVGGIGIAIDLHRDGSGALGVICDD